MKTKQFLALSLLASPVLLAFALPGERVSFAPKEGSTLVKTMSTKAEFSLDSMSMSMNGQPSPAMPEMDMTMTATQKVVVSDEYVANREGAPKKLKRRFDTIDSDASIAMKIEMMGQSQSNDHDVKSASELLGKTVVFTWDAESEAYKKAFEPAQDDTALLEGLEEDMDLRVLLPDHEVKEGEEWEIDVKGLSSVLAPGGNLSLVPEKQDASDSMNMGMPGMGSMSEWFDELLEGEAKGKFTGTREVDGVKMAVIAVTVKIKSSKDMTSLVEAAMKDVELPPEAGEMKINHMDLDFELDGTGELVWNIAAGHLHSFEMSGPASVNVDIEMNLEMQGTKLSIEQSMEMSGTTNLSYSAE